MRYIGNKTQLLHNIEMVIRDHAEDAKSFCDIFSGTASVARYFKKDYEVYSNDLLYFSYCLQRATIENDSCLTFEKLKRATGIDNPIEYFNRMSDEQMESLPQNRRFFQNTYSPNGGRMYMTDSNALRIDYTRITVEDWYKKKLLSDNEYYYLVASIVEGVPFISNIAGTYGAYSKKWDPRSNKKFELIELPIVQNGKQNKCYNEDGLELLKHISGDILYIDPPYNSRQYLPNYHVLETAARYDYPEVRGVTGQRPDNGQKSDFCSKRNVLKAFEELIANAQFKHIFLSYSTDGIMQLEDIKRIMQKYGKPDSFEVTYISYKRFKSNTNSKITVDLKEMVVYISKEVK